MAEKKEELDFLTKLGERPAATPLSPADMEREYTCPMDPEVRQQGPGACPKCGMALEPVDFAPVTRIEWTCPMHPEIVRDAPGSCPICGMALEPVTVTAGTYTFTNDLNPTLRHIDLTVDAGTYNVVEPAVSDPTALDPASTRALPPPYTTNATRNSVPTARPVALDEVQDPLRHLGEVRGSEMDVGDVEDRAHGSGALPSIEGLAHVPGDLRRRAGERRRRVPRAAPGSRGGPHLRGAA